MLRILSKVVEQIEHAGLIETRTDNDEANAIVFEAVLGCGDILDEK